MTAEPDALRLVQVPYVVLSEAAGLLDCEGYGPLAMTLNNLLAAAPAVQPAAGREEIARAVNDWIRDDASLGLKLQMDRVLADKLTDRILAAISTPAQTSGEPVTWQVLHSGTWREILHPLDPEYWRGRGFDVRPLYTHPPAQASETGGEALRDALEAVQIIRAFPSNQGEVDGQITAKGHRMLESCCDDIEAALSAPQAAPGEGEGVS